MRNQKEEAAMGQNGRAQKRERVSHDAVPYPRQ
jgi:hypothetical protein